MVKKIIVFFIFVEINFYFSRKTSKKIVPAAGSIFGGRIGSVLIFPFTQIDPNPDLDPPVDHPQLSGQTFSTHKFFQKIRKNFTKKVGKKICE